MLEFQSYLPDMELHYFLSDNPTVIIEEMKKQFQKSVDDIWEWVNVQRHDKSKHFLT